MDKVKNVIAVLLTAGLLFGCSHTPTQPDPPKVVVQKVYVLPQFSGELVALPANVPPLNLETATQKEVSAWLIENERRMALLERRILAMKNLAAVVIKKGNLKDENVRIIDVTSEEELKTE
jgi:hypothetical protein